MPDKELGEFFENVRASFDLNNVLLRRVPRNKLLRLSRQLHLSLTLDEMLSIQRHYDKLGRDPTDVELETFAQTWSEHCFHKTFRGIFITNSGKVDNLFKTFIEKATMELDCRWCLNVFMDNAGIVEFDEKHAVSFKVETHNHPSAIEPFGGAATGVGGVIRDTLGVWADPIAGTDVLCFGPLDYDYKRLPKGVKHPRYIFNGVVAGVGSYGNNIGIPTVNGAILFDESYVTNPLVYCGSVGFLPKNAYVKDTRSGDVVVLAGGKTGVDGIHGVTFASASLSSESGETSRTAVQIGNPIEEEKLRRAIIEIRDRRLATAITDLGGGGLSSAVSESAEKKGLGVEVLLDKVPLKYPIKSPWKIWISESQERMLLSVSPRNLSKVLRVFEKEEVLAVAIGKYDKSRRLRIKYRGREVANIGLDFLFSPPTRMLNAKFKNRRRFSEPSIKESENLTLSLLKLLAMPNIASKENVIRTYDHEIKGSTVLKPMNNLGPGDAAVLKPMLESWKGIVIANGINPEYGKISSYWMTASAIDEAIRNNVAVGGRRIAILDNFSWGDPNKPKQARDLVEACKACYKFSKLFAVPFISGKDSLYNESESGPVTPTMLISSLGIMPDIRNSVSMDAKESGNLIIQVGETYDELGGSHYYKLFNRLGANVPKVRDVAPRIMKKITELIDAGAVRSCHDLSEGGLGVAAAEMAFAGDLGMTLDLSGLKSRLRDACLLFSESNSRFLIEVKYDELDKVRGILDDIPYYIIGEVGSHREFKVLGRSGKLILSAGLEDLRNAWKSGLK